CDTVGARPWIPAGAAGPRGENGSQASTATSGGGDGGVDVAWVSERWGGVLKPGRGAAEKAGIASATRRLSGDRIQLSGRPTVLAADPIGRYCRAANDTRPMLSFRSYAPAPCCPRLTTNFWQVSRT